MVNAILGAADLANGIASATKSLATAFGLSNPDPKFIESPEQGITAEFQREHWYKNPSQGLYSFSIENAGTGEVSEFPAFINNIKSLFTADDSRFGEFKLPITPQEITQTEDFAVTIKPTQGGTVVNHSGNKYKTLTVAGTTGVQPFKGLLGAFKGTGLAIGKPDELKYRSGYEVFQHFRQWMRSYHETKAKPGNESLRMLFRNYKDWEFLYVEPIKFTMKRDAADPLLYNYFIQLKVLGVHAIEKPLFDLAVAKLNEISATLVNSYILVLKNKSVSEFYTGTMTDFQLSINNLKYAIKTANKEPIGLAELTAKDIKKLSHKYKLQVLRTIGQTMSQSGVDIPTAEASNTVPLNADPVAAGLELASLANNPALITPQNAEIKLNELFASEPALLTNIDLSDIPDAIKADIAKQQEDAALISAVKVSQIRDQAQSLSNKLAEGVGLGDATFNSIFGITPTILDVQTEVTDDQFEMLYALSQAVNSIDGILASDEMFDINTSLFKKSGAANGSDSVGLGIFSFPDPNSGIKQGFLPEGVTLEDIALAELGDSSRWTEIAELNNLKAPYIRSSIFGLSPNYKVESSNFSDPTDIEDLQIGFYYLIPLTPTPVSAWTGKGNYIVQFEGGSASQAASWRFIYPDEGTLVYATSTAEYFRFANSEWILEDPADFNDDGILKPGDIIKIPSTGRTPISTPIQGPRNNPYTVGLTNSERALSVDLRLNDAQDLDLTPAGDLNVAFGSANGAQAIILKLLYEKGSLKKFPGIGTTLTPGKKIPDVAAIRTDLTASLLQDTRIKEVNRINIIQENGTITLSFDVFFKDIQEPVPINIPL